MSTWGETRKTCTSCQIAFVDREGEVCGQCLSALETEIREGLEAVEGYLGKQAAFADYLRANERGAPKDAS